MDLRPRDGSSGFPDQGPAIIGVSTGVLGGALILVAIRLLHRIRTGTMGVDDLTICLAVALSAGHSAVDVYSVIVWGVGRHRANLTPAQLAAGSSATLGWWIAQILYKLVIPCTKLSICLLYHRLFERAKPAFKVALYCLMAFIAAYYTGALLATIFQCTPVSKSFKKSQPGTCISTNTFFMVNAIFNIVTDVAIIAIPIPVIHALQLPRRQRFILCLVFAVGLFATATSVIRLFTLNVNGSDPTWDIAASTVWSSAEMNTAIICACLPVLKAPLQAIFPRLFGTIIGTSPSRRYAERYGSDGSTLDGDENRRFSRFSPRGERSYFSRAAWQRDRPSRTGSKRRGGAGAGGSTRTPSMAFDEAKNIESGGVGGRLTALPGARTNGRRSHAGGPAGGALSVSDILSYGERSYEDEVYALDGLSSITDDALEDGTGRRSVRSARSASGGTLHHNGNVDVHLHGAGVDVGSKNLDPPAANNNNNNNNKNNIINNNHHLYHNTVAYHHPLRKSESGALRDPENIQQQPQQQQQQQYHYHHNINQQDPLDDTEHIIPNASGPGQGGNGIGGGGGGIMKSIGYDVKFEDASSQSSEPKGVAL